MTLKCRAIETHWDWKVGPTELNDNERSGHWDSMPLNGRDSMKIKRLGYWGSMTLKYWAMGTHWDWKVGLLELHDTETIGPMGLNDTERMSHGDTMTLKCWAFGTHWDWKVGSLGLNDTERLGHWDSMTLKYWVFETHGDWKVGSLGLNDTERLGHNPAFSSLRPRLNLRVSHMGFVVVGKGCVPWISVFLCQLQYHQRSKFICQEGRYNGPVWSTDTTTRNPKQYTDQYYLYCT